MALFDKPLDELRTYQPAREEPADFDAFWAGTLAAAREHELAAQFTPVESGLRTVDVFDVTYRGYGGQPIKGWLVLPALRTERVPCVVHYIGYGGGRGFPFDWLGWPSFGIASFVMDTRGQGSTWSKGHTPDPEPIDSNPHIPGFMTRGILSPYTYYYRRVFTDAVRAVEAAQSLAEIDPARIAVAGGSQGGGITLAAAGMGAMTLAQPPALAMPDVPFLCNFERATAIVDSYPYQEIVRFCKTHRDQVEQVFATLKYFDGMSFAARAKTPALFSVGLMDDVCPPSTVYAAYNHYAGEKEISVWRFNQHEGGQAFQFAEQVKFLRAHGWI